MRTRLLVFFPMFLLIIGLCCEGQDAAIFRGRLAPHSMVGDTGGVHTFRYTNPLTRDTTISMRDHFIIKVGCRWYCVGTSNPVWTGFNPGVRLLVSRDLINWEQ